MSPNGPDETTDDINEVKLLGYFETIKGTFITKWVFLLHFLDDRGHLVPARFQQTIVDGMQRGFVCVPTYAALSNGSHEIVENYKEDMVNSAILGAWSVFELLTKDLPNPNYAHSLGDVSVDYQRNDFGLTDREKRNLEVIYYVRNSVLHYNGAYFANHHIDRYYGGQRFVSAGHYGEKIEISASLAWGMVCDVEGLAIKAWSSYKRLHP